MHPHCICRFRKSKRQGNTRDGNICAGLKLDGISYAGATQDNKLELAQTRMRFFNRLDQDMSSN